MSRRTAAASVLLFLGLSVHAAGDVLVLRDGRAYTGELLEATRQRVMFRARVDGRWQTLTVERSQVRDLFEDPGNQADEAPPPEPPADRDEAPREKPRQPGADGADGADDALLVVVPLHGQVGGLIEGSVADTFDAEVLARCLDRAAEAGAAAVVLDIESPGGFLDEMEAICRTILGRRGRQRIVALTGEALSAAAVIALCCEEIVVRPHARIGAAVMLRGSAEGLTALEAKLASPHHALQRQFMAESGRPYELLQAMSIQEAQLWWSATGGFTGDPARAAESEGFTLVDGATTVLTMTADDAVRWGVARGTAREASGLAALLGMDEAVRVVEYGDAVERYLAETDRRLAEVLDQFRGYFQGLSRVHEVLGQMQTAAGRGRSADLRNLRDEVRRLLRTTESAAGAIRRADRRLLARRTELPGAMIDQLDNDAERLEEIGRLLGESSTSALGQARQAAASILERWREMMSGAVARP